MKSKKFLARFCYTLIVLSLMSSTIACSKSTIVSNTTSNNDKKEKLAASKDPPGSLKVSETPQFVVLGFDDNYSLEGMTWVVDLFNSKKNPKGSGNVETFDDTSLRASFYNAGIYIGDDKLRELWNKAYKDGFDVGSHTYSHETSSELKLEKWKDEMKKCNELLLKPFEEGGVGLNEIFGFRAPYLAYNNSMIEAVKSEKFMYDCSITEGSNPDEDGTNYYWPYTLDEGSPGNKYQVKIGIAELVKPIPGLWEMPVYYIIVPPDEKCEEYGIPKGLRAKLKALKKDIFDDENGKIVGFDYNLWDDFKMSKDEVVATLKYSLDLKISGNRSPFTMGVHTHYYEKQEKQDALKEFIEYAISKPEVRVVSAKQALDWIKKHVPIK